MHTEMIKMESNKRNIGIDFLRILSMFYVIILHSLGRGGIVDATVKGTPQYMVSWFLEIWALCAVNIFALISGYVGYHEDERPVKIKNYIILWMQVVFYTVGVTLVFKVIRPELVTKTDVVRMLFPVTNRLYWYFTAYTALFLCMPLLNIAVRKCSKEMARVLFVVMFCAFSVYDTCADVFSLFSGYSFAWLAILYILGAILKKCEIGKDIRPYKCFIGIVILVFVTWFWKMHATEWSWFNVHVTEKSFVVYTSPTMLAIAILYVVAFSKLSFHRWFEKLVAFAAPGAFAVYLLNNQYFVSEYGMNLRFAPLASMEPYRIVFTVLGFAVTFVVVAIIIDRTRDKVFHLLHVDAFAAWLEEKLRGLVF